jgi:hypothetical protein
MQPAAEGAAVKRTTNEQDLPIKAIDQSLDPKLLADRPSMGDVVEMGFSLIANQTAEVAVARFLNKGKASPDSESIFVP